MKRAAWIEIAVSVVASLALRRLLAAATIAGSGFVAGTVLAPPERGERVVPIKQAWLTKAGGFRVERVRVPCPGVRVDLSRPPVGVGHTVEGSFESGLAVFRRHYAPHFLVGRDRAGRVRILQFCPLGELAAALQNLAGGVETNRWARAQIELAGFSKTHPWQPDAGVMRAYAALLLELRRVAGIPLVRPFPDRIGERAASYAYARRRAGKWGRVAGWYNHAEVPENAHWDAGSLRWSRLFALAEQLSPVLNRGHGSAPPATKRPSALGGGTPARAH